MFVILIIRSMTTHSNDRMNLNISDTYHICMYRPSRNRCVKPSSLEGFNRALVIAAAMLGAMKVLHVKT